MGKAAFSAPQSEIAGAILATRMEQKISKNYSMSTSFPPYLLIAKNDHASPPVFYGTRLMEIASVSTPDNWFWYPGNLNPADLLTRSGTRC